MANAVNLTPQKKVLVDTLLAPFRHFIEAQASAGVILLICTVAALLWANSADAANYFLFWDTHITIGFGDAVISKPLLLLINDGLMAIFFFVVGLEIKRELLAGELSTVRQAALPFIAAVGGMVVPALIYVWFNPSGPTAAGWGIPMATDIAFAIGIIVLFGKGIPLGVRVFLTALAIVDDLGAVLVIALFYTSHLDVTGLGLAALFLGLMIACNLAGVRNSLTYAALGVGGLWVSFLFSGVHPTIAGVLAAFTIPAKNRLYPHELVTHARDTIGLLEEAPEEFTPLKFPQQQNAIHLLRKASELASSPLDRLERALHPWVMFAIMPIFAFANAGVTIEGELFTALTSPLALGITLGLFFGKQLGIFFFARLAVSSKLAALPANATWAQIYGASCLGGIGFTMSLFIASLAFQEPSLLPHAKIAILAGSLASAVLGCVILLFSRNPSTQTTASEEGYAVQDVAAEPTKRQTSAR